MFPSQTNALPAAFRTHRGCNGLFSGKFPAPAARKSLDALGHRRTSESRIPGSNDCERCSRLVRKLLYDLGADRDGSVSGPRPEQILSSVFQTTSLFADEALGRSCRDNFGLRPSWTWLFPVRKREAMKGARLFLERAKSKKV